MLNPERRATEAGNAANDCADDCVRARALLGQARALLLDLDGTLLRQDEVITGARDLLRAWADRALIVSNNSTETAEQLSQRLSLCGLSVPPGRIILAGASALAFLAGKYPGAKLMLIGSEEMSGLARSLGFLLTSEQPDIVLVARAPGLTYAMIALAANAIARGAMFFSANPDGAHPGPGGSLVPETGAIAGAVAIAAGKAPDLVFGKPGHWLFQIALDRLALRPEQMVMIGDNAATDGAGAAALGMPFIRVGSGLSLAQLVAHAPGRTRFSARTS